MESTINLESDFSTLMDASSDAFAIFDPIQSLFVAVNFSHNKLFGYSITELNESGLGAFYGISNTEKTIDKLRNAASYEIFICTVKAKDGKTINIELSSTLIKLHNSEFLLLLNKPYTQEGNPFLSSGILSIEQAFKDSEAKWQAITENSPDHIMMVDTNGIILFINHTVAGLSVEEVIGKSVYNFVSPEQVSLMKEHYSTAINTGKPVQFDLDYRGGDDVIYLENRVGPVLRDGRVIALIVTSRDVSERVRTFKQLEKSQRHLHHALKAGRTGTWELDLISNDVTWSDGVEAMFGMEPGSFQGSYHAYRKLVHPDDVHIIESAIEQTLTNHAPYYVEHRCIFPDGSIHWLSGQGKVYRDETGKPLRMVGTVTDITQRKIDEAHMQQQDFLLSKAQEIAQIGSYSWDIKRNTFQWSDEMHRIFGISKKEFDGGGPEVISEAIHPDDQHRILEAQKYILTEKKPHPMEYRVVRPDGSIRHVWADGHLNLDEKGEIVSMIGTVQDITDRVLVQKELEKHRLHLEELVAERTEEIHEQALIIDQVHDSVVSTNLDGVVKSWNKGAEKMFGYSADQAIGQNISFVYPVDQHDALLREIIPRLKEKGELKTEVQVQRKNGERFYALLLLSVKHDLQGNPSGLIGYTIDITDRKITEKKLLRQQKALEAANKELEAFAYSVSHDLRSPLRAIDGFSAEILDNYYQLLDDQGKDHFRRIRNNAQRMAALIDDLLQLSRVSRHQLQKETISLSLLAQDIVQKYKYENPDRDIAVEIEDGLNVEGDPGLLRIALDNLISNAWKYTQKTESPKIELFQIQAEGGFTYCIKDNGAGFDMRYVNKLFGAFQRLHAPEEFSGNGIGLATVSRIINRHGGKIWAEGTLNQGAKFFFTLGEH